MRLLIVTQKVDREDENLGFFHRWLEEFAKHFSEVVVITRFVGVHHMPDNVSIFSLGDGGRMGRVGRLWRFWELFSFHYARSKGVFFHMIPEFVIAASPFLLSLQKSTCLWYVHKSVTPKLKLAEKLVDFIFSASEMSFRLPSKKVLYTGHAIDTSVFYPALGHPGLGGIRMVTVGRISPVKDYETIIRACSILKTSWKTSWSFSLVGGPLMKRDEAYFYRLKKMVQDMDLGDYVFFQGSRPYPEIPDIYRDHDMFLSMSTTGSVDKAVLEAMSSGLTVITANEAFRDVLPRRYFLEKRSPEFLAERIKVLADENRPNLMLRKLVVEYHSLERTIQKIIDVILA